MRIAAICLVGAAVTVQSPLFVPASAGPVRVGPGSGTVLVEDLNRDGRPDLVTRHLLTQRIAILLGRPDGRFSAPADIRLPFSPADVKLGDVNGDGTLDLATTANTTDIVHLFAGDGRGGFTPIAGSPYTLSAAKEELNKRTLSLVDLNEDGHLDVVTANGRRVNTMQVLLGDGRGGFRGGPPVILEEGRDRYWYAIGDIDDDGHLDIVTVSTGPDQEGQRGRLLAQRGDGTGRFRPIAAPMTIPDGAGALLLGDLNSDGHPDAMIAHADRSVSSYFNDGSGRFMVKPASLRLSGRASSLTGRDVNGDGRLDLLAASGDVIDVLLQAPSGYRHAPGSPYRAGPGAYALTLADLNRDGRVDMVAPSFEGENIGIWIAR